MAVALVKKVNAEIISCDSMQIYRKLDILSSKPSVTLRKKVPHHLIDILPPTKEYNVSKYRKDSLKIIKSLIKKGKVPLFVGGTGLYVNALVDGIFNFKSEDETLRLRLYRIAKNKGSTYLHQRLKRVDPEAAEKIHPNDTKRIVRALEVFEVTGKPISHLQKQRHGLEQDYEVKIFCLNMARENLYKRINERVDKMFRQGLVNEVKGLLKLKLSKTASFAIGIRELRGYLEGLYGIDEARQLMQKNTRSYAKRQLTWFRKDKRIKWINIKNKDLPGVIAERICSLVPLAAGQGINSRK